MLDSTSHYENFPVGSWLVPRGLRPAVSAIYRFARHADDLADEGEATADERLAALRILDEALEGHTDHPLVAALRPHMAAHRLDIDCFHRLLSAFSQDVIQHRYDDWSGLLDYCHRSADPVGQLMLQLFASQTGLDLASGERLARADALCSALQLINFCQDMAIDWSRGRIYLPLSLARDCGLAPAELEQALSAALTAGGIGDDPGARRLREAIAGFHAYSETLLQRGAALIPTVPLRLSLELRAICAGGQQVLDLLRQGRFDPFAARPKLGLRHLPALFRLFLRA